MPAVEAISTALPRFWRATTRRNSRKLRNVEVNTASSVQRHCRNDMRCIGTSRVSQEPALAIKESRRPNRFMAAAKSRLTSPSLGKSALSTMDSTLPSSRASALAPTRFERQCKTSFAPSAANWRARAEPIPPEAPVIKTTLFERCEFTARNSDRDEANCTEQNVHATEAEGMEPRLKP